MLHTIILSLAAAYCFFMCFMMQTKNMLSSFIFKFAPFLIGMGLVFVILEIQGALTL